MSRFRLCIVAAFLGTLFGPDALSRPLSGQDTVGPPDVHLIARTIQEEVEVLRWNMGRPLEDRRFVPVEGVAIRENFGLAMSLWRKINQLGVELVGGGEAPPIVQLRRGEAYGPAQVAIVLNSALARLQEIRDGIGIVGIAGLASETQAPALDPDATPADVFQVIVQANRQVNRMLERQAQPGDVYQQVQQATFYASEILAAMDDDTPFPGLPEYEPGLRPAHVYGRLLVVFDRLYAAFDALGLPMVRWAGGAYNVDDSLTPSDVYDLATLMLSELEHLHQQVPGARAPLQAAHPGRRWPSDVYQQAGVLTEQAARIMAHARANPNMISRD